MSKSTASQRGFTYLEVLIVMVIAGTALAGLGKSLTTAQDLSSETHLLGQAHAEHRRNFEAIGNALRSVDINTLTGFVDKTVDGDVISVAANPTFARVIGTQDDARVYSDTEELRWESVPTVIDGIANPGQVSLVTLNNDGTVKSKVMIGKNVPSGGFLLRQEGRTLVIALTTYYVLPGREPYVVSSESAVSLRN